MAGGEHDVTAKLIESIHGEVEGLGQTKVGAQVEARGGLLGEVRGRERAQRSTPGGIVSVADDHITVRSIPGREPHAVSGHIVGMLDAGRGAQFPVVEEAVVVVGKNPSERQRGRESPLGRIGTAGSVPGQHQVGHVPVPPIVVEGAHDVLAIVGISTSVGADADVLVNGGGVEVVVIEERMLVVEPDPGFHAPPLTGIPVGEGEVHFLVAERVEGDVVLVADGAGIAFIAILVRLVGVLRVNRGIGIAGADEQAQALEQEPELLGQPAVHPQLALMGLVEAGILDLGDGIGVTEGLVAAPDPGRGLEGESAGRQVVDGGDGIVGREVGRPQGLLEQAEEVHRHKGRRREVEIDVGADIGFRLPQLRIVVRLPGVLERAAHIDIVEIGIESDLFRTAVHRDIGVVFRGGVLESTVAPVLVRVEERVGTVLEEIQFLRSVRCGESVILPGMVESIGIGVTVHHIGEFGMELELVAVVRLDMRLAFGAAFGRHENGTIDTGMTQKRRCCRILENGHAFHFLDAEAVDGTFVAVDEDKDTLFVERVIAADIERSSLVLVAGETALRQGRQSRQASIQGLGKVGRRSLLQFFARDGDCGGGAQEIASFRAVTQIIGGRILVVESDLRMGRYGENGRRKHQHSTYIHIVQVLLMVIIWITNPGSGSAHSLC